MDFKYLNASPQVFLLIIEKYSADTVSLRYKGLPGNQPYSYGNFVAIWESTTIPWASRPLSHQRIPQNSQMGSYEMDGLTITKNAYIVGYGVGSMITDICAVARISTAKLIPPPDYVYLSIFKISIHSLVVHYFTLSGYLPKTYGNWIGLWEGFASPYNAPKPVKRIRVKSNANQGTLEIKDIELKSNTIYTLVYFMGADQGKGWPRILSNAAAILNFQTANQFRSKYLTKRNSTMQLTADLIRSNWAELSRDSMRLSETHSITTSLKIDYVTADSIGISYGTLPGNQPNSYGNYVAIWQNTNSIPWNTEPMQTQAITTNTQSGSTNFHGLDLTKQSYIIGYAVGPELTDDSRQEQGNICSTAYVPEQSKKDNLEDSYVLFQPSLRVIFIGTNSLAVDYSLPSGVEPMSNGAWIGLWRSEQASYNNPPLASNNISIDAYSGTAVINDVNIGRGLTYTVGLFTSGWGGGSKPNNQQPMACAVTFTN